jgi:putative ABC transport system permease protein
MVYVPLRQESRNFFLGSMTFLARVPADATATAAALREQLWATDPELPAQRIAFLDRLLTDSIAQPRFRAGLLLAFAAMALALALVGIYGVLTYEVSRRTAEIGIRRALGARTHDVLWLVIGRTAALIAMGIVVGAASAAAATRALESILFAVGPMDVGTFAAVSLGLAGAAILTSLLAARRVAWVEPAVALRDE